MCIFLIHFIRLGCFLGAICLVAAFVSCGTKQGDSARERVVESTDTLAFQKQISYRDSVQERLDQSNSNLEKLFEKHSNDFLFDTSMYGGQLLVGDLFRSGQRFAVFANQLNDSTMRSVVLRENSEKWDTVFIHSCQAYFYWVLESEIIHLEDFDGDSKPDLRITFAKWDIHPGELSLLWLYKGGELLFVKGFEEIVSPMYDKDSDRIYSYQSDGCSDMDMQFYVYRLSGNQVKMIDDIFCECCACANGECRVLKNGKSKSIKLRDLHLAFPLFFREMIKAKASYCS